MQENFVLEECKDEKEKYYQLLDNMPAAYAEHKIILNEKGKPVDYIFLEVNKNFEKMTGLKKDEIIGKKLSEVFPGISEDRYSWVESYGQIALHYGRKHFVAFSQTLNKWFDIYAYSQNKGFFTTILYDITDKKNVENVLKKSRKRLKIAQKAAHAGVWEWDAKTNNLTVSEWLAPMFGYNKKQISDINKALKCIHSEDCGVVVRKVSEYIKSKRESSYSFEFRTVCPDGRIKWAEMTINGFRNQNGELQQLVGIIQDITERKKVSIRIRESENKFRVLAETTNNITFIFDHNGNMTYCNKTTERLLGYKRRELLGKNFIKVIHPDFAERAKKDILTSLMGKSAGYKYEVKVITKSGKEKWLKLYAKKTVYKENNILLGQAYDITREKEAEMKIRESEAKFKALAETAASITFLYNTKGGIVYLNKTALYISGYKKSEIMGKKFLSVIHPSDKEIVLDNMKKRIKGEKAPAYYEIRIITKNSREKWLKIYPKVITVDNEKLVLGNAFDITKSKELELELIQKENQLRTAVESRPFDFFIIDKNGCYVTQNRKCRENWGNVIGKTPENVAPDKEKLKLWQKNNRLAFSGKTVDEVVDMDIKGRQKYIRSIIAPVRDDGNITSILGINIDITEQKKAADALSKSENKFRILAEQSPNMIFINYRGRIAYVNKKCVDIMGYNENEFYSPDFDFMNLIAPEDREMIKNNFQKHMKGEEVSPYEYKLITKSGKKLDVIINTKLISYKDGKAILGIVTDISYIKEAEKKIISLAKFPEKNPNPNIRISKDHRLIYANSSSAPILKKWKTGIGNKIPQKFRPTVSKSLSEDKVLTHEEKFHETVFYCTIKPVQEFEYVNVYCVDVTERKKAEDLLKKDKKMIEKMVDKKSSKLLETQKKLVQSRHLADIGALAASVAHELRNPLGTIKVATMNLKRKTKNIELLKHVKRISKVTEDASGIINELLFYARLKSPEYKKVKLLPLINEAANSAKAKYAKYAVKIEVEYKMGKEEYIEADPLQLNELLSNIINNAYEAFESKKGIIKILAERKSGSCIITFRDNGPGIKKDIIEEIKKPFFSTKPRGIGLGLSICQQIVLLHNGSLEIRNAGKRGTVVTVSLPLGKNEKENTYY